MVTKIRKPLRRKGFRCNRRCNRAGFRFHRLQAFRRFRRRGLVCLPKVHLLHAVDRQPAGVGPPFPPLDPCHNGGDLGGLPAGEILPGPAEALAPDFNVADLIPGDPAVPGPIPDPVPPGPALLLLRA